MRVQTFNNILSFIVALVIFLFCVAVFDTNAQPATGITSPGSANLTAENGEVIISTEQQRNIVFGTNTANESGRRWYIDGTTGDLTSVGGSTIIAPGIGGNLNNDTFLTGRNFADTLDIGLIKADVNDDTIINSDTGNLIRFTPAGTLEFSFTNDRIIATGTSTTLEMGADSNRVFTFGATSDTSLTLFYGDGITANQISTFSSADIDGSDDTTLNIAGSGFNTNGSRGAFIQLPGNEAAGGSNLLLGSGLGSQVQVSVGGTTEFLFDNDIIAGTGASMTLRVANDANRLFTYDGASDTALTYTFGDAGVTASQVLTFSASTPDADDDSRLNLAGGGAPGAGRGASISLYGEDTAGGGDVEISSTTGDIINLQPEGAVALTLSTASSLFAHDIIQTAAGANILTGASSASTDVTTETGAEPKHFIFSAAATQSQMALMEGSATVNPVQLYSFKSRAVDGTADTIVQSGDQALSLAAFGADGTNFEPLAAILMSVSSQAPGNDDMPGRMDFFVTADGAAALDSILNLTAASTTSLRMGFGDAAGSQTLNINSQTADAADTDRINISAGGGTGASSSRGGYLQLDGNELTGQGVLGSGSGDLFLQATGENVLTLDAPSTTALNVALGEGSANQIMSFHALTADAADTFRINISAGGATLPSAARGAYLQLDGNELTGQVVLGSGASPADLFLQTGNVTALTVNENQDAIFTSTITSTETSNLGWTVVDGADDTSCESQCTSAAVYGWQVVAGNTTGLPLNPGVAADICLCAGSS